MILGNIITKLIHDKELSDSELNFLFCSLWNGVAFDDNEVVRIPFYLLTSIT